MSNSSSILHEKSKLQQLLQFTEKKRYITSGVSFAKKMWRDGYNKALLDIKNFILYNTEKKTKFQKLFDELNTAVNHGQP